MNQKPGDPARPGDVGADPGAWEAWDRAEEPEDAGLKRKPRDLRLPHERDEAPDPLDDSHTTPIGGPRQVIEQAASDLSRGLVDTDLHGLPSDVPAPGPAPEESPGAEVLQADGIDRQSLAKRGEVKQSRPGKDANHT